MFAQFQSVIDALGWTLIHVLWQATIIGLAVVVLRQATRLRYALSAAAMGFLALTALSTFAWEWSQLDVRRTQDVTAGIHVTSSRGLIESPLSVVASETAPVNVERSAVSSITDSADATILETVEAASLAHSSPVMLWIVAVWATGVVIFFTRLLADWLAVRRLKAGSQLLQSDHGIAVAFEQMLRRLNVSRSIGLFVSERLSVPVTFGIFKPVIVLPASLLTGLPKEQIEALLLHELAHVRRFDYVINLFQTVMETLLFFHPVVWWLSRQMRIDREFCCDDSAVTECASVGDYAAALLALEGLQPRNKPALVIAADGARPGSLLHRIRRLSGPTTPDTSGSWMVIVAGISVCLMCAILLGQEGDPQESTWSAPAEVQSDQPAQPPKSATELNNNNKSPQNKPQVYQLRPNTPVPQAQSAFGVVVDEAGNPIPDVKIQAATPRQGFYSSFSMPTGGDDIPGKTAVTDSEGKFRIDGITPEFWREENGKTPVMLSLRTPYRWRNDQNYPLGESLRISMRGSGKQGTLRIRLIDDVTDLPLNAFTVVKRHNATTKVTTNPDGEWEMKGGFTRHRNYNVYCYADGYEAIEVRPEAFDPDSDERTVVRLKPRPSLAVSLVDSDTGKPVSSARMMAARLGDKAYPARYISWGDFDRYVDGRHSFDFVQHGATDEFGLASFSQLPQGKSAFIVYTDGYQRMVVRPEDREQFPTVRGILQIGLQKESKVVGRLTNRGKPVAGASASVGSNKQIAGLDQMMESTRTDAEGNYVLHSLAPGSYWITVAGRGNRIEIGTEVFRHDVALQGTTVYGQAAKNATLRATPKFNAGYEHVDAHADKNGKYEISGLAAGPHKIKSYGFGGGLRREFSIDIDVRNVATMKVDVLPPAVPIQYRLTTPANAKEDDEESKGTNPE